MITHIYLHHSLHKNTAIPNKNRITRNKRNFYLLFFIRKIVCRPANIEEQPPVFWTASLIIQYFLKLVSDHSYCKTSLHLLVFRSSDKISEQDWQMNWNSLYLPFDLPSAVPSSFPFAFLPYRLPYCFLLYFAS